MTQYDTDAVSDSPRLAPANVPSVDSSVAPTSGRSEVGAVATPEAAAPTLSRGICSVCGKHVMVRDGVIRGHRALAVEGFDYWCPGTGEPPRAN